MRGEVSAQLRGSRRNVALEREAGKTHYGNPGRRYRDHMHARVLGCGQRFESRTLRHDETHGPQSRLLRLDDRRRHRNALFARVGTKNVGGKQAEAAAPGLILIAGDSDFGDEQGRIIADRESAIVYDRSIRWFIDGHRLAPEREKNAQQYPTVYNHTVIIASLLDCHPTRQGRHGRAAAHLAGTPRLSQLVSINGRIRRIAAAGGFLQPGTVEHLEVAAMVFDESAVL